MKNKQMLLLFLFGVILLGGFLSADNNCMPNMNTNEYYGTVYLGNQPLTGGNYTLKAIIGNEIVGAQEINLDGSYSIDVSPCPDVEGGKILFVIGDVEPHESGIYEYDNSAVKLIPLDLTIDKLPNSVCGNKGLTLGEECDDGNNLNWDGCSDICEVELGYECVWNSVEGSICTLIEYCGDGICNNGETCSSCPGDCGSCGSSSDGGRSSGGGGSSTPKTQETIDDSIVNLNFEVEETKESEEQTITEDQIEDKNFISSITGAVIGLGNRFGALKTILVGIFLVVIIIIAIIIVSFNKREKIEKE